MIVSLLLLDYVVAYFHLDTVFYSLELKTESFFRLCAHSEKLKIVILILLKLGVVYFVCSSFHFFSG